jgi:predicted nucleic acid-binding Zn ribbon protein
MPTYEYVCKSGHETTVVQSIKDDSLDACTAKLVDHNGNEVVCCSPCKRQIAGCSFILKGAGWTGKGGI